MTSFRVWLGHVLAFTFGAICAGAAIAVIVVPLQPLQVDRYVSTLDAVIWDVIGSGFIAVTGAVVFAIAWAILARLRASQPRRSAVAWLCGAVLLCVVRFNSSVVQHTIESKRAEASTTLALCLMIPAISVGVCLPPARPPRQPPPSQP